MRRACIDIGSNTTRLLVADCDHGHLRGVHQARAFTRIGRSLLADGTLTAAKVAEVGEVVAEQLAEAHRLGAEEVRCVATAALRRAVNQAELINWIARRCDGLLVEVLPPEDEARLAFLGASNTLGEFSGALGVVDVGGGSSELVVGTRSGGVLWWESVAIGSGDLGAEHLASDPPSGAELAAAGRRVNELMAGMRPPAVRTAVAVGGSATSLLQLGGSVLDACALHRSQELLTTHSAAEVAALSGLDVERVRLLPAGLLILQAAAGLFGVPLRVCSGGLREGVVLDAEAR